MNLRLVVVRRRWAVARGAARIRGDDGTRRLHQQWVRSIERKKRPTIANVGIAREPDGWCCPLAVPEEWPHGLLVVDRAGGTSTATVQPRSWPSRSLHASPWFRLWWDPAARVLARSICGPCALVTTVWGGAGGADSRVAEGIHEWASSLSAVTHTPYDLLAVMLEVRAGHAGRGEAEPPIE